MLAYIAIAALLAATEPVCENVEDLENQEEMVFCEEENEEVALNEDSEYQDLVFFEDESESSEELLAEDE